MKRFSLILVLCLLLTALLAISAAAADLDAIRSYDIFVSANEDGSLNMRCYLEWEVLDSESEGPLTWVKIGIPNRHAEQLEALSSNIDRLERNGSYIEVYFDREYEAGETVNFGFSWVQSYMYTLRESGAAAYVYTPGWFDEINVDTMTIHWASEGVRSYEADFSALSGSGSDEMAGDEILVTAANLAHGDKASLKVNYAAGYFPAINPEQSAEESDRGVAVAGILVVAGLVLLIGVLVFCAYRSRRDPDYWTGGYEGEPAYQDASPIWFFHVGHGFVPPPGRSAPPPPPPPAGSDVHVGGTGCACACACACAGGGRAGCTRKNILGPRADMEAVRKCLERNEST